MASTSTEGKNISLSIRENTQEPTATHQPTTTRTAGAAAAIRTGLRVYTYPSGFVTRTLTVRIRHTCVILLAVTAERAQKRTNEKLVDHAKTAADDWTIIVNKRNTNTWLVDLLLTSPSISHRTQTERRSSISLTESTAENTSTYIHHMHDS